MGTAKRLPAPATRSSRGEIFRAAPSLHRLEQILAETADGAFVTNPGASIILWNRAAERLLGWTRQEAVGLACCKVLVGVDRNGSQRCRVLRARPVDDVRRFEMQTCTKAGRVVWLDITAFETRDAVSAGTWVHLFHDVTATVRALDLIPRPIGDAPESWSLLTAREFQILALMAGGLNTTMMAARLSISGATIRNHLAHIFEKLDVHSRLEAVTWMRRHELFSDQTMTPATPRRTGDVLRRDGTPERSASPRDARNDFADRAPRPRSRGAEERASR